MQFGLGGVWIFRDSIPLVKDILSPDSPITQHIGQSISLNTFFFIILGIFMYVVLSAFLGSTVARPEDTGKAISPLMMLVMVGFFGVTALGSAGDVPLLKIGPTFHSFQLSSCHSVPSMAMQVT